MKRGLMILTTTLMITACGGGADADPAPTCGWDMRTEAGRQASDDYWARLGTWEIGSDQPIPQPNSPYFVGNCGEGSGYIDPDAGIPSDADAGFNDSYQWGD